MTPERREYINGKKVEEYHWNYKLVVYVDNQLFNGSYEEAIEQARKES